MTVWPYPQLDPVLGLVAAAIAALVLLTSLAIWSRRLTTPVTPMSLRRWREGLLGRADGPRREAEVTWWAALHDGLSGRRIRRMARRYSASAAALHSSMVRAERPWRLYIEALRRRRSLGPPLARAQLSDLLGGRVLPLLAASADWVIAARALRAIGVDAEVARLAATPIALAMALSGRMIAIGIRRRRYASVIASTAVVVVAAAAMASLQGFYARQWFVFALAPVVVSVLCTSLSHAHPDEVEAADHEVTVRAFAARRALRSLTRALRRAEQRRTAVMAVAAPSAVCRPHVGANGDTPPISALDGARVLEALGIVVGPDLVERAHALLDRLTRDMEESMSAPHLRAVS